MGKAGEAMYSQLGVDEDDADAEDLMAREPYRDEPYRDDPSASQAGCGGGNNERISTRYRDVEASIFDWEDMDTSRRGGRGNGRPVDDASGGRKSGGYGDLDGGLEVDFAPVNLDDSDEGDDSDEEENLDDGEGVGDGGPRGRGDNRKLQRRVLDETAYDEIDDDDDEDIDRIFVGGGMGRHGSYDRNCCVRGACCCSRKPKYSSLKSGTSSGPARTNPCCYLLAAVSLAVLIAGCGLVGYEAGLTDVDENNVTHTNAEEWWEWVQEERKRDAAYAREHWRFNFTHMHTPQKAGRGKKGFGKKGGAADPQRFEFEPMTQSELLSTSQRVFASCGERSVAEPGGRNKCLSLCHGRYCCFERDPEEGSCVGEDHSYCFAYAACENVIVDFGMNNVQTDKPDRGGLLDAADVSFLEDACSMSNIATLDGIRDCTALCQHHLCCFSDDPGEDCRTGHEAECEAYEACRNLADGPVASAALAAAADASREEAPSTPAAAPGPGDKVEGAAVDATDLVCGKVDGSAGPSDAWVSSCHDLCSDYLCCFTAGGTRSNCRDTLGDEVCDAYSSCSVLHPGPDAVPGGDGTYQVLGLSAQAAVVEVCTSKVRSDPSQRKKCDGACRERECCFQQGPGNCYNMNTAWCEEFAACEVLYII